MNEETMPRVRVMKEDSDYYCKIGYILFSNCDGTFHIRVNAEGFPEIDLEPSDVDPC